MQTDEQIEEEIVLYDDDSPELLNFMRRIGPAVIEELQKNNRSHAFDGEKSLLIHRLSSDPTFTTFPSVFLLSPGFS